MQKYEIKYAQEKQFLKSINSGKTVQDTKRICPQNNVSLVQLPFNKFSFAYQFK